MAETRNLLRFTGLLIALFSIPLAIYLEPLHGFIIPKAIQHSIPLPQIILPSPAVFDSAKDITYLGSYSPSGVEHFQNIFYAKDTSGKRRFAPPVPVNHEKGAIIDATKAGAWCPQALGYVLPFTSRVVNVSENCLSLRVARPRGVRQDAKLPVVVWIHGGGHALGSGSDILYEPDGLVKQAAADGQPLIYVAINYRLGFFGFATSKAMVKAKQTNAGLRDQRAALEWVRDNIEAFGGDPNKVTAIGQSVGASDIGLHLTSYGGKQGVPFQQAIMMSGAPGVNFNTKSDLVENNTAKIATQVGCVEDDESQSEDVLQCLRERPMEQLRNLSVSASQAARPPFGEGFFAPTFDDDFIPDRPTELMRAGKFVKGIPVIASWVTNDGAWYAPKTTSTDEDVLRTFGTWLYGLSDSTNAKLLDLYPIDNFEHMVRPDIDGVISAQYYRAAQMNRDIWFTCPVLDFAWQYAKHGGVKPAQVHLYEHNSTRFTPIYDEIMGVSMWRVSHLSDIPYVLNNRQLQGGADNSAAQLQLAKSMAQTVAKFVNSGSPEGGSSGVSSWPAAFHDATWWQWRDEFASKFSLQLFGGPYGTQPVTVNKKDGHAKTAAEEAVHWAKLFDRCAFINSKKVREEAGV